MKHCLLALLLLCAAVTTRAALPTLRVERPGTLAELIAQMPGPVRQLKLSGQLGDADFHTLRSLDSLQLLNLRKVTNRTLPDSAFFGMTSLERVVLPRRLERVGVSTFECCRRLLFVEMSKRLTAVGDCMFKDCQRLDRMMLYREVEHIGRCAFMNAGVRYVFMPELLRTVDIMAFAGCKRLEFIHLPANVLTVRAAAFAGCTRMRMVYVSAQTPPQCAADAFREVQECALRVKHPEFFRDRQPWSQLDMDYTQFNGQELKTFDRSDFPLHK